MGDRRSTENEIKRLYEAYADDIYRFARLSLNDAVEANDVVQEVFVRAFSHWDRFRREASERTWLMAIARNYLCDTLRKRRKHDLRDPMSILPAAAADESERTEFTIVLQSALTRLRQDYRDVFLLRHVEELTVAETAEVLGWSPGKVRVTDFRAMGKLRADLMDLWEEGANHGLRTRHP